MNSDRLEDTIVPVPQPEEQRPRGVPLWLFLVVLLGFTVTALCSLALLRETSVQREQVLMLLDVVDTWEHTNAQNNCTIEAQHCALQATNDNITNIYLGNRAAAMVLDAAVARCQQQFADCRQEAASSQAKHGSSIQ